MAINVEVKSGKIPQGEYRGRITRVEKRDYTDTVKDETFSYIDLTIGLVQSDGGIAELKRGAPMSLSPNSALGKLARKFDSSIQVGASVDVEALFLNKEIVCYVQDVERDGSIFSEIQFGTITPKA